MPLQETDHLNCVGPVYDLRDAVYDCDIAGVEVLLDAGVDIDARDHEEGTALMWAADEGQVDLVRMLLRRGASVNLADREGWTPLLFAAQTNRLDVVRLLLLAGADVTAKTKKKEAWTALFIARRNRNDALAELLLAHGAME